MTWPTTLYRTVLTWVGGAISTLVGAVVVVVIALADDTSPLIERVIRAWSRLWLVMSGTSLEITGQEHVDPSRSYVVVANHLSTLDIMVCLLAVPLPLRFLAKKELFRVPALSQGMRAVGIVRVDRDAHAKGHASVNVQAQELLDKGRSLIIYAEGTRPRDGVMRPFKKGAFTMAIAAGLPVLPLSIHGTYEAAAPGRPWIRGGHVRAVIDPPIETSGLTRADSGALRDEVKRIISKRVTEMGGEVS